MHDTCEKICPDDRYGRRIEAEQMPPAKQPKKCHLSFWLGDGAEIDTTIL
jgi:hypothetical protein